MKKILEINFKFKIPRSELEKAFLKSAPKYGPNGEVKGLLWKIWLVNESEKLTGGIFLFKDEASVNDFLKGEIFARTKSHPALSDFEVKVFDIMPEPTKICLGPVD
jgi:hypothetical protein